MADTSDPLKEQLELLKFLREEAEANRTAQKVEADANRKLLTDTFKIVSPVVAVVFLGAGFLGVHDLNTLRDTIRQEAQAETQVDIKNVNKQVTDTVAEQFQQSNIQRTIKTAAETATKNEAKPLIEAGIKAEVRSAVAAQSGMITHIATEAVGTEVAATIKPLKADLENSRAALHVQELAARANADDANAFDELLVLRANSSGSQKGFIDAAVAERYRHAADSNTYLGNSSKCLDPTASDVSARLFSKDLETRKQAVADCSWVDPGPGLVGMHHPLLDVQVDVTPMLVSVALHDSSLSMRAQTITILNSMFASSPEFPHAGLNLLDLTDLRKWWTENHRFTRLLLLVADIRRPMRNNFSSVPLFQQLRQSSHEAPERLAPAVQRTLNDMIASARLGNTSIAAETQKTFNTQYCFLAMRNLTADAAGNQPDVPDDYDLQKLRLCPADTSFLPFLRHLASATTFLFERYGAIQLLNDWGGTHIDPFDFSEIKGPR